MKYKGTVYLKTARERLGDIYFEKCREHFKNAADNMSEEAYDKFTTLHGRLIDLADTLARHSDEELENMRHQELVIRPACPLMEEIVGPISEHIEKKMAEGNKPLVLEKLCTLTDCDDYETPYGRCWATESLTRPDPQIWLNSPEMKAEWKKHIDEYQKDWHPLRKMLYDLGKPTPILATEEETKKLYEKLAEKYRQKGEFP